MKNLRDVRKPGSKPQRGTAAVEFALIAGWFFLLLLGIIEFGRFLYVWNTVQEVTRRAAREAVVRVVDDSEAKTLALFGGDSLPAGAEIKIDNINIEYLSAPGVDAGYQTPFDPAENIAACLDEGSSVCIRFVEVSITGAQYAPMIGLFTFLKIDIPASTVVMPAESLGYRA